MWFIIGLLIGGIVNFILGFILAMAGQAKIESDAVKNGYIKLGGKMYLLTPLDISKKENE